MAPTRMKLRVRRRDNAAAGADGPLPEEEERSRESVGRSSRRKNTSSVAATASAASSSSPPAASASARAAMVADEASPDSKCPICLDRFNNLAYLDRCLHRFCFPCIQEWSHNKPECPLCKQPFTSILHSVRAEDDFKEYTLRPAPANSSVAATVAMVAAMASAARSDHQMRMLLQHRGEDSGSAAVRRRRRDRGGRGAEGRRTGVLEWYLDSHPPRHPAVSPVDSDEGGTLAQQSFSGGPELAERGVIFEGLTGLGGAVAPLASNDRTSRRLMTHLAMRQRLQREGGTVRRLREREMVGFRRALYRCGVRVRGVAGVNEGQQQRDITAEIFRQNPAHLNRLRPWLRRELTVLYGAHGVLVHIVQRIIMARLARHGLEDTPTIEEELRPFLLARTDHFLHELVSFARSPLSLDAYDLQAVYEPLTATLELDGLSSASDSSSVISISEGEEEERRVGGRSEERPHGTHDDIIQSGSCLSLSAWDDETPGPSYSTAEPTCSLDSLSFSPAPPEVEGEGEKEEVAEEECLIVGYKKPIAERTPELVQLSSDTDDEAEEKKKKEELTLSLSPSTSGACRAEQDDEPKEKVDEAPRSWSGSSGRSRESVLALSQDERQQESWRDQKQSSGEVAREKRRRRKRRRGREKSSDWLRKSGTLYNPNRSIYPAMMQPRSPSPFHSSIDSGSPLPPSPPNSSWEYNCSPLTSSASSPSRSFSSSLLSSSPQPSPPPQTPPTPSLSHINPDHGEKPGGKRKYKSRHLDSNDKDPTWRPSGSGSSHRRERRKRKKAEKERRKRRGRRRERHRKESSEYGGESSRRCREDRSPSVEIIYEGTITSDTAQPPACKRRRKRHRKSQHSSSPVIITLDSDSSHGGINKKTISSSSSPISSQQTVDFSDLPPLPLVHTAGVGGTLGEEIGELPVDILDRGSDGSETEPMGAARPIAIDNSDNSDPEVDVENVEESSSLPFNVDGSTRKSADSEPTGDTDTDLVITDVHKKDPGSLTSDNHLLATILNDLKEIAAPKCELSLNFEPSCSPETRRKHYRNPCQVRQANSTQDGWLAEMAATDQNQALDSPTCQASILLPPSLKQSKESRVREEGTDVPPPLKQANLVQSCNKNTLPPLKHKDGGDLRSPPASDPCENVPAGFNLNSTVSLVDFPLAPEVLKENQAFPPNPALKGPTTSTSSVSAIDMQSPCHLSPVDSHSVLTNRIHSSCCTSSFVSENSADSLTNSSKLHSSHPSKTSSGPRSSSVDLHPVNFHSANSGWSVEDLAHAHSTSGGLRDKTLGQNSYRVAPIELHPCRSVSAEDTPAGCGVFSGINSNYTSSPGSVPPADARIPNSPIGFSNIRENLSERLSSVPTAAPSGRFSPTDMHHRESATDHFSSAASDVLTNSRALLLVNNKHKSPHGHSPYVDLTCTSPASPGDLHSSNLMNATARECVSRTALSSSPTEQAINCHTSHRKCTSQTEPTTQSHSEPGDLSHRPTGSRSKHNLLTGSQQPVDFHPKNSLKDFQLHAENHFTSSPPEHQWNSSADVHPDSQLPVDERPSSSIRTTHTLPHRTDE